MRPILIQLGPFGVPTYGVLVALGYLASILWLKARKAAMGLDEDGFWTLVYAVFAGALVGGKLLYWMVESERLLAGDWRVLTELRFGFVFYGGFAGAVAAGLWASRRIKASVAVVADHFAAALPLGHAIGRLGCLAAGCCYGRPADGLPWAVTIPGHPATATPTELWGVPLHPAQLYESLGNLALFLALGYWILPRVVSGRFRQGSAFWAYVALYSALRFCVEFWRGDDRGLAFGALSVSQALSAAGLTAAFWAWSRRKA